MTAEADEGCDTLLRERTLLMLTLSPGTIIAPRPSTMLASESVFQMHFGSVPSELITVSESISVQSEVETPMLARSVS